MKEFFMTMIVIAMVFCAATVIVALLSGLSLKITKAFKKLATK